MIRALRLLVQTYKLIVFFLENLDYKFVGFYKRKVLQLIKVDKFFS